MKELLSTLQLSWPARRSRMWGENNFEKLILNALMWVEKLNLNAVIWVKPSWPPPFHTQKGYSKGYHWQNSQPISDPKTLWKWRRSRGGDALWETDMLCWELTILPSHQCCATFRFKEHVWLVVNTSFNQGWPYLGSNWPRRSAAPVGCCPDWIRQIIANAGCGSPLAPWWASLLLTNLPLMMPS